MIKGGCSRDCAGQVEIKSPDCSWSSNSPVYDGTPVQFTGPSGMDSYNWEFGDGATDNVQSPSHIYSGPGTYAIRLNVSKDGCFRACEGSVTVMPLSECGWTSNSPVCDGRPVRFDGPSGMDRYLWNFGDGSISKSEAPSHTYRKPGTYAVSLTAVKGKVSKRSRGKVVVKPLSDCS